MPYKNDNLEELFQAAAEDYPLKTDNSNWDSVAARLNESGPEEVVAASRYKFWKYAAIAILLLGGSAILYTFQFNSSGSRAEKKQVPEQNITNHPQTNSVEVPDKSSGSLNTEEAEVGVNRNVEFRIKHFSAVEKQNRASLSANDISINNDAENQNQNTNTGDEPSLNSDKASDLSSQNIVQKNEANKAVVENKIAGDTQNQNMTNSASSGNSAKSAKQAIKLQTPPTKFYGTLYGSPEFSMVKFQQVNKPGYKIGIALGYRINSRVDAEIGIEREHISYYTNGKYFDKTGLKLKDPVSLENVNGSSKLTSVPITVKYKFLIKNKSHLYTGVGADAILLTHTENYQYAVSKNGNEADRSKNYSSVTSPKYFTGITMIVGYETKLFNWGGIKVEPYYQIPTSKVGVGKLPVTSFGINIGIVKDLK
ncbi:MAG: hypothetical protein ABI405_01395 [Parafilimonas sp.]